MAKLERKNLFPDTLYRRVVSGHLLYAPVVTVRGGTTVYVSGLVSRDKQGNVICWSTGGNAGFKGSRKSTPFAAQVAAEQATKVAIDNGVRKVDVYCKGPGAGRETSIRTLAAMGIEVLSINDVTPVPHNGCRPPKRRRG